MQYRKWEKLGLEEKIKQEEGRKREGRREEGVEERRHEEGIRICFSLGKRK